MINWFAIPAINLDRAVKFYTRILNCKCTRLPVGRWRFFLSLVVSEGILLQTGTTSLPKMGPCFF